MFNRTLHLDPGDEIGAIGGGEAGSVEAPAETSTAPARDYGKDIDGLNQNLGRFTQKFDSFLSDYQRQSQPKQEQAQNGASRPDRSKYPQTSEGVEKWMEDLADWKAEQKFNSLSEKQTQERTSQEQNQKHLANANEHVKRMGEARTRYPDFDQVVNNAAYELPPAIAQRVMASKNSADIQYYLSKDAGELASLMMAFSSSKEDGIEMLGEIRQKVSAQTAQKAAIAKRNRVGVTAEGDGESGGSASEGQDFENIVASSFKMKPKR